MGFKSRKLFVFLISLGAVLAIYLLYSHLTVTSQIDFHTPAEVTDSVVDSNVGRLGGEVGMVGDLGIGKVKKARFIKLNDDTKEIEREFGFEELLHRQGDEWEVEKPYMNDFQSDLNCYLTADRGWLRVETAVGKTSVKNATFTGNVVVHILPGKDSDIKEGFIYFDNLVFISEKSQYSTAGPVKFVSEDTQMLGRGLELVYNETLRRLEYLRIIHLESLSSKAGLFSSAKTDVDSSAGTSSHVQTAQPAESVAAGGQQKEKPLPTTSQQVVQKEGEYYKCLFSDNVVIDSPEQLILADEFFINDIFWSKSSDEKSNKANAEIPRKSVTSKQSAADAAGADKVKAAELPAANPTASSEQPFDVVVTCDNGILVTPMDSPRTLKLPATERRRSSDDTSGRTTFIAPRIDYSASTEDVLATGPSELTFDVNDPMSPESNGPPVPVKITARKKAKFLPALNQAVFEGDCRCTMLREDLGIQRKYTLLGPKLTVHLSEDKSKRSSDLAADIEHLTASGGVVRLATVKMAGKELLGGIELKCARFDFDVGKQELFAAGPGMIVVYNSKVSQPNAADVSRYSLRKPCWVFVRDFETLNYSIEANQIIADTISHRMLIDYFPIVGGKYGEPVWGTAGHIEANLIETADGQFELSTLTASGGITYEDVEKEFAGSTLFHDTGKSIVTMQGDESWPCLFNGALVDAIEYDLITGKARFQIVGPGGLRMKR